MANLTPAERAAARTALRVDRTDTAQRIQRARQRVSQLHQAGDDRRSLRYAWQMVILLDKLDRIESELAASLDRRP